MAWRGFGFKLSGRRSFQVKQFIISSHILEGMGGMSVLVADS